MGDESKPLQLRLQVLQLRMDYLSGKVRSPEDETKLLTDLEIAVAQLNAYARDGEEAGKTAGSERRKDVRAVATYPAVLRLRRKTGETFKNLAITRDVAKHGMSLLGVSMVSPFEAKSGETITVDLGLPGGRRVAGIEAEVRWCTPVWVRPGHFLVGLRFLSMPEAARTALEAAPVA